MWFSVIAGGVLLGCSSSTAPKPSLAGTWHVAVQGSLTSGSLSPDTFSLTVVQVRTDSYTVTMPSLVWSTGPVTFDSGATAGNYSSDTSKFVIGEYPHSRTHLCEFVTIQGTMNPGRDTLTSATMLFFNADTIPGGYCSSIAQGIVTVHK
jgi:hypothetical protein